MVTHYLLFMCLFQRNKRRGETSQPIAMYHVGGAVELQATTSAVGKSMLFIIYLTCRHILSCRMPILHTTAG